MPNGPNGDSAQAVVPTADLAERGLLCALIKEPGPVHAFCAERLELELFYNELNRLIYETIETWEEPDSSINWIWLKERLRTQTVYFSKFAAVSDADQYLNAIYDLDISAGVVSARHYLKDALEALNRRRTIRLFEDMARTVKYQNNNFHQALVHVKTQIEIFDSYSELKEKIWLEALPPTEIESYVPLPGTLLVGDNHIVRGAVFIIGGCPGVGKSRATVALAEAGATGMDWLGLPVKSKFKTLIIQNENGRYRLKLEFENLNTKLLDQYLLISPPPPFGLRFEKQEFRDQLKRIIDAHQPAVIIIDPWNAVVRDDKARDYSEGFDMIRSVIPTGADSPALGIIAHTRKPFLNERSNGRALLNTLAGSYILNSVPRSVWILQHASDEVTETRVVVTCSKNNDGKELGPRTVWTRDNGLWSRAENFDWDAWDHGENQAEKADPIEVIMLETEKGFSHETLIEKLMAKGMPKSTAYRHVKRARENGQIKFSKATELFSWIK